MSQKAFKKLRKLARKVSQIKNPSSSLPEAYMANGQRVLNPGREKGTYKWLKKNKKLIKRNP